MFWKRLDAILEQILLWSATILFIAFFFSIIIQVFTRYVLQSPTRWSEEAARYLNIWAVFLGAGIVTKRKAHLKVDLLERFVKDRWEKAGILYSIVINFLIALTLPILAYGSYSLILARWNISFVTIPLSQGLLFLSLAISSVIMFIYILAHLIADTRKLLAKES